jgi:hypothetical protein
MYIGHHIGLYTTIFYNEPVYIPAPGGPDVTRRAGAARDSSTSIEEIAVSVPGRVRRKNATK